MDYAGDLYCALRVYAYFVNQTLEQMQISSTGGSNQTDNIVRNGSLILSKVHEMSINATTNTEDVDGKYLNPSQLFCVFFKVINKLWLIRKRGHVS